MMIAGKLSDIQILIKYYGEDATVMEILTHAYESGFNIFEAQDANWDSDLF